MEHGLYISRFKTKRLRDSFKYQGIKILNLVSKKLTKIAV